MAHCPPLRTHSGKHEHRPGLGARGRLADGEVFGAAFLGVSLQLLDDFRRCSACGRHAEFEMSTPCARGETNIAQGRGVGGGEHVGKRAGKRLQRIFAAFGNRGNVPARVCVISSRLAILSLNDNRRFFEESMRVCTAITEGVHADERRAFTGRHRLRLARQTQTQFAERNIWVLIDQTGERRDLSVAQAQRSLDNSSYARGRFKVADIRLYGTQETRTIARCKTAGSHSSAYYRSFDRITNRSTGTVDFHITYAIERYVRLAVYLANQSFL